MIAPVILLSQRFATRTLLRVLMNVPPRLFFLAFADPRFGFQSSSGVLFAGFAWMPDCITFDTCTPSALAADDVAVLFGETFLIGATVWEAALLETGAAEAAFEGEYVISGITD